MSDTTNKTPVKTSEAPKAPEAPGNMKNFNAEAFFAPVIAALIATGVSKDGIRSRATAAYWDYLSLCDWVNNGKAVDAWRREEKLRELRANWKVKDDETTALKSRSDQLKARLATIPQEDANYSLVKTTFADVEAKYKAAEVEAIALLRQVRELEEVK